jgi:GH25 family lysozyme M1 (1,4-beta-N-acetylmuramidase)
MEPRQNLRKSFNLLELDMGRTLLVWFLFQLVSAIFCASSPNAADCSNIPTSVTDASWCDYLGRFPYIKQSDPNRNVDGLVKEAMAAPNEKDNLIRSYAFVISIWNYRFNGVAQSELSGVKKDHSDLLEFLKGQGFDEAMVLENDEATTGTIRNIFTEYYLPKFKSAEEQGQKIRFLFIFNGHGWKPINDETTGALALASLEDQADFNYDHRFSLAELRGLLQDISPYTQSMVALLGSCYSASVFVGKAYAEDFVPGNSAWIAAAAPRQNEAWELPQGNGTVFFQSLISMISNWVSSGGTLSPADSASPIIGLDSAPNLRQIIDRINYLHGKAPLPQTGVRYPPIVVDTVAIDGKRNGAFRFIVPRKMTEISVLASKIGVNEAQKVQFTGSSVVGHSDISVVHVPEFYTIRGIDLSHGNIDDNMDFSQIKKDNEIRFVYFKATQGATFVDGKFKAASDKAKAAGLEIGAYHTFDFCQPVDDQYRKIISEVPLEKVTLPIALDIEWYDGKPGFKVSCSPEVLQVKKSLRQLSEKLKSHYGKQPVYYLVSEAVKDFVDQDEAIPTWIANYSKGTQQRGLNGPWTFWQFTDSAHLQGIRHKVDLNVFFGDEKQFQAYLMDGNNVAKQATISNTTNGDCSPVVTGGSTTFNCNFQK